MQALLDVILPVFVVVAAGYGAVWMRWFSPQAVDGLMKFTQDFAIPCLLFTALSRLDLGQSFDWRLLLSFYAGALTGFLLGLIGARLIFARDWEDAVVIGFCCLFSNSVLLGLALTERAYGAAALAPNYAIIALHAPFCYVIGISAMETVRAGGDGAGIVARRIGAAMARNPLVIGIALGLLVNLSGLTFPAVISGGLDMIARAALPAALFGLGGVLVQYRPEGDLRVIAWICLVALVAHPLITRSLGGALALGEGPLRSAVLTAAMAPGANAYIFASIYGRARRVAASAVLIGTGLSTLSAWVWMALLP
ncbi:AEC family transporter [Roseovarius spongiae]|uniref:AEC family transporter n=1 Tax=Roseovarius spongiae TaxID=2320272 RepID=A0A3A8B714_9RHOB|nr:AEC family transporter [Roseovarius spongiae]RKF17185.1 AEC family transporter [Roseovarius spongiae]